MPRSPCQFDQALGIESQTTENARDALSEMLRCAALHACRRSVICSDRAIDLLNRLVLKAARSA